MKQAKLLLLTISLIIMCGCSNAAKHEGRYTDWRLGVIEASEHEIEAVVASSDDEKVCEYTLLYTQDAQGETVEVLAPELIANIKAHIGEDKVTLSYDGVLLETGSTLPENLSPLMATAVFMDIIREGHFENAWRETLDETELIVTELEMPDGTIMTLSLIHI